MGNIYTCSDLHGQYELWRQIRDYLEEDDKLIFLGDAIDRGPHGIQIMLEMFKDKRVIYLIGNHEEMMYNAFMNNDFNLWISNGGYSTYEKFSEIENMYQEYILNEIEDLMKIPYYNYTNDDNKSIFLSHSGGDYEDFLQPGKLNIWNREHIGHDWSGPDDVIIIHGHTPVQYVLDTKENPVIYKYCNKHKIDIDLACFYSNKIALLDLNTLEPIYFEQ